MTRSYRALPVFVVVAFLALAPTAHGAGELDLSFDGDGRVLTDFGPADQAHDVAIQADGKVLAAGTSTDGNLYEFALARYNGDGTLDTTFDGDGRVRTSFGNNTHTARLLAVAIQADGKIVALGGIFATSTNENFALARYNADGSLDTTFDGDGIVVSDFGASEEGDDVAIQADGRIVAAGGRYGDGQADFQLARYNSDGSLDTTFDGDGRLLTDFAGYDEATDVDIQGDGRIVAGGGSYTDTNDFALARYNPDGSLDTTFDGDGKVLSDFGGDELASGMAIQADGRIVLAGQKEQLNSADFALARYNPNGGLDATFGGDGLVTTAIGIGDGPDPNRGDAAQAVAIQADGKIVAVGHAIIAFPFGERGDADFALARYDPDGSLDPSFDGDGTLLTNFGDTEEAEGVAVQADGRIVAAGWQRIAPDFALARYLSDGVPVNQPPDCSGVRATPNTLSPPNHKLRAVTLSGATDPDDDPVSLIITTVTQDEPLSGFGDGDTAPDAQGSARPNEVLLRAERSGRGDGRVYRVAFTASDSAGGSCSGGVTVGVPLNAQSAATDSSPPSFNSRGS